MCYRTGKYTVCRRVRTYFSPELLQAGAVKGLIHCKSPSIAVRLTIPLRSAKVSSVQRHWAGMRLVLLKYHWRELPQVLFLLQQTSVCRDKRRVLSWQKYACRDKTFPVKIRVCRDKTRLLSGQKYACRDKTFFAANTCLSRQIFVATKVFSRQKYFVATNIILSRQKWYLWQLQPMILKQYGR